MAMSTIQTTSEILARMMTEAEMGPWLLQLGCIYTELLVHIREAEAFGLATLLI